MDSAYHITKHANWKIWYNLLYTTPEKTFADNSIQARYIIQVQFITVILIKHRCEGNDQNQWTKNYKFIQYTQTPFNTESHVCILLSSQKISTDIFFDHLSNDDINEERHKVITEEAALVVTVRSDAAGASVGTNGGVRVKDGSSSTVPPPCCIICHQPISTKTPD